MLIVRIKAGLGNQMFQYAFGKAMALRRNEPLLLDLSAYDDQADRDTARKYLLDRFNITAKTASKEQTLPFIARSAIFWRKVKRNIFYKNDYAYHKMVANSKEPYFEGWFANEKYFKDYSSFIRNELTLKDPLSTAARSIAQSISGAQKGDNIAVSLHVRRGDYISNPHAAAFHGAAETAYYENAVQAMREKFPEKKITFFIFSDDISWVRDHIAPKENSIYVSGTDIADYEEIHIMSLCNHHIIANSSFSWWGAWLNAKPNKVVIAPKKWVNDPRVNTSDATPSDWLRL